MRTVLLASLRVHTRRYVAAVLAVSLAVAFVIVTDALASAARSGLNAAVETPYAAADLVAGESYGITLEEATRVTATAEAAGATAWTIGSAFEPLASADGRRLDAQTSIGTVAPDATRRWQEVVAGRGPASTSEALMDENAAAARGVEIGDLLTIGDGENAVDVEVVGLSASAPYMSATLYLPWETVQSLSTVYPDAVLVAAPRASLHALHDDIALATDVTVSTAAEYVDQRRAEINDGIDVVAYLVLVFAAVAAFVALLVVANTFTILFAQRSRDLALLRAVGAGRRQLLRSVRLEALVIGVLASLLGLVLGALAGQVIAAVARWVAGPERVGAVSWSAGWWLAAFVGGVLATVLASWWPTRAVVRISPLAALRPDAPTDVRSRIGRRRLALGLLVVLAGVALLVPGVAAMSVELSIAGCFTTFVGVLVLGPVVVPPVIRLLGRTLGRTGAPARLAVDNAVRNPRRTAATTASLLVGVTLTATILTVMASGRDGMESSMNSEYPVDLALTGSAGVSPGVVERVRDTPGVGEAVGVPGTSATTDLVGDVILLAPSSAALKVTRDAGETLTAQGGEVLMPLDLLDHFEGSIPEVLRLTGPDGTVELDVRLVFSRWGGALVVTPGILEQIDREAGDLAVWAQAAESVDAAELDGTVGLVARDAGLELTSQLQDRAGIDTQLDILVGVVVGLLGVAVLIALAGIGNTLGLSVLERGRENALLRALGLTRGQLRRSLAIEGLLLALAASVMGTALGVAFGWTGVRSVVQVAVPDAALVVPVGQLLAVTAVAAAAGVAACLLPARRAGRISPAAGLVAD